MKNFFKLNTKGNILILVIVLGGASLLAVLALLSYAVGENQASRYKGNREQALQIAEAGIAYYRWHLAHDKTDYQDGTGAPGPYVHDYKNKNGDVIGHYSLIVDPPTNGSTIVTVYSTGWLSDQPDSKRTLKVRLGFPAISDYAFLVDGDLVFSSTAFIHGKTHSNGVITFNGVSDAPISSALSVNGTGGPKSYWLYPVPRIDLADIQLQLNQIKTKTQANGLVWPYLAASGAYGYQLTFRADGKVDVSKVLADPTCYSGACYDATSFGTATTYDVPTSSFIFVDDTVWVNGVVNGRVTVATIDNDIIINGNLSYLAKDGMNSMGLMTNQNIVFPYNVPDPMEVDAALATANGTIYRPKYYGNGAKDVISIQNFYGSRISGLPGIMKYVGCGSVCSGFLNTNYIYDANLTYRPPAGFPVGSTYNLISWEEVRSTSTLDYVPVSTITVSPSTSTIPSNTDLQFTASALPLNATVKKVTWSVLGGDANGTITANGLYTAPNIAGNYTVMASADGVIGIATVTVTSSGNQPPSVAVAPSSNPSTVTSTTAILSVLGTDDGGESNLTYQWSVVGTPPAVPTFSINNTNAAKNTVVTFSRAGTYQFQVRITDNNSLWVNSQILSVTVAQALSSIIVSPSPFVMGIDTTQQFSATSSDQFGQRMQGTVNFVWSVNNGSVDGSGLYTPGSIGVATINATSQGKTGQGSISLTAPAAAPTIAAAYSNHTTNSNPVTVGPHSVGINQIMIAVAASNKNSGSSGISNLRISRQSSSGGTVTWTEVSRNYVAGRGATLIYVGKPSNNLTNVYTNFYSGNSTNRFLEVFVIDGASGVGTTNKTTGSNGNPSLTINASGAKSLILTVGYDMSYNGTTPTFTETLLDTWLPGTEMAWTQRNTNPTPSSGNVVFGRTAPIAGGWNMAGVEIKSTGVGGLPPTIATPASASPSTVNGTTSTLSVLGADDGGEVNLTYTWSVLNNYTTFPDPTFSPNNTNGAKNSTATFYGAGNYELQVTISDANGNSIVSPAVPITVNQTLTTIQVLPSPISLLAAGSPQQFEATSTDQFGMNVFPLPTYTWTASAGTVNSTGLYYPPAQVGDVTVNASSNGVTGVANVTVSSTASGGPNCTSGMCIAVCGDGIIEPPEQCDDGNTRSGDGCSSSCTLETIPGITCTNVTSTAPNTITMPVTYQDFKGYNEPGGHPDFERYGCWTASVGLVQNQLVNGKPAYARASDPATGCGTQLTGANYLAQWYVSTSSNRTVNSSLTLNKISSNPVTYQFDSGVSGSGFFPLDSIAPPATFGITPGWSHDFGFTTEAHYWFTYQGGEVLSFSGDDDVWVFINGKLALDLGGLHPRVAGSLTLDAAKAASLGLVAGNAYDMALFNAERHTSESNFKLTIGGFIKASTVCASVCGDHVVAPTEQCDNGAANGTDGICTIDCKWVSQGQL